VAVANFPLEPWPAREPQRVEDLCTAMDVRQNGVSLGQHLPAPQPSQLITEVGRVTRPYGRNFAIGHPQTILPEDADPVRQRGIHAADRHVVESAVLPSVPG